jgi:hypothetical protein
MITIKVQRDGYLPKGSISAFASRDVHFPYGLFMDYSEKEIEFARELLEVVDFGEYPCNNNQFFSTLMLWLKYFKPSHFTSVKDLEENEPKNGRGKKNNVWAYPELALLPGHQSKLMDMWSVLNRYDDVNIVTLSEYMIRKSQILVVDTKNEFYIGRENIKIFEVYPNEDEENDLSDLIEVDFSVPNEFTII